MAGLQRLVFRNLRKIPAVKRKIDEEIKKAEKVMKHDIKGLYTGENQQCVFVTDLPKTGLNTEDLLSRINEYLELGRFRTAPRSKKNFILFSLQMYNDFFIFRELQMVNINTKMNHLQLSC